MRRTARCWSASAHSAPCMRVPGRISATAALTIADPEPDARAKAKPCAAGAHRRGLACGARRCRSGRHAPSDTHLDIALPARGGGATCVEADDNEPGRRRGSRRRPTPPGGSSGRLRAAHASCGAAASRYRGVGRSAIRCGLPPTMCPAAAPRRGVVLNDAFTPSTWCCGRLPSARQAAATASSGWAAASRISPVSRWHGAAGQLRASRPHASWRASIPTTWPAAFRESACR